MAKATSLGTGKHSEGIRAQQRCCCSKRHGGEWWMELLLLPAFRLHMDSCSFTNEQWPEEKQPLPFPAILPCSIHPPWNRARNYLFFTFQCWCVGFRTQKTECLFLAEVLWRVGSCYTEPLNATCRASLCALYPKRSWSSLQMLKSLANSQHKAGVKGIWVWRSFCRSSFINNINLLMFIDAQEKRNQRTSAFPPGSTRPLCFCPTAGLCRLEWLE